MKKPQSADPTDRNIYLIMRWHVQIFSSLNILRNFNKIKTTGPDYFTMPKRGIEKSSKISNKRLKLSTANPAKSSEAHSNLKTSTNMSRNVVAEHTETKKNIKVEYLDTPVKSEADKKEYRVIKLPNGLTALLISDVCNIKVESGDSLNNENSVEAATASDDEEDESESGESEGEEEEEESEDENEALNENDGEGEDDDTGGSKHAKKREEKMAACGLCVGVGSFSDPPEIQGLAHFLEHMVFMGSKKYPEENDFDAFIRKRGGSDNASTECEQTTFYFEVHEKHLMASMQRFAQFFISPLMKRDAINREREAVESEFQMAVPSDSFRKDQLFCTFAQPDYPATKFTWGNLKTLKDNIDDDKLYEELHKFRERHYSAHRMTLAIQARLSLDTLEAYVKDCFSDVPSNGLPPTDFSAFKGVNSFDTENFRRIYKIKPVRDICQVDLTWAMPSLLHLYKSKPHHYVSWILGHDGKGSLISYLRKKMWCLAITSGNSESGYEHSSMYALFTVSLVLTDEGHEHLQEVLEAVFSYINMMIEKGPQKRIYDEIHQIEEINFRFTDEEPPVENVETLCENMHFYAPLDYMTGSELCFEYDPEAITSCLAALSPEKVNIIISDKKFDDEKFDKVEPWFNTRYTDEEIPQGWVETWKSIKPKPEFHLPEPNVFITQDFTIIPVNPQEVSNFPTKIHSDAVSEIWYRPDPVFRLPECYMNFFLISPLVTMSPQNASMTDLFAAILSQLLIEEVYPASVAGLNYSIAPGAKGLVVKVDGLSEKLPLLLHTVMKYITNFSNQVSKDLFDVMKRQQMKAYYNTFLKPSKLAKDVRLSILMHVQWPAIDKHAAAAGIEFDQFVHFTKHFTDNIYIQCLVQGNLTREKVIEHAKTCVDILQCKPLLLKTMPQYRIAKIPAGTHCCRVRNFNPADVNSVVTNYYQLDTASIKLSVLIELLIMIMEEPLFNQLRTQEQLGYNVFCLLRDTHGILGYSVTVCTQANKFSTETVDEKIEEFLKFFRKLLAEMSDVEFSHVKDSLTKLKQCADIHLKDEVTRNWGEITTDEYIFDRLELEVLNIEEINLKELRNWVEELMESENVRKLSIQVVGTFGESGSVEAKPDNSKPKIPQIEYGAEVEHPLKYLTDAENEKTEKARGYYITDTEDFKRSLYFYPVVRTKV